MEVKINKEIRDYTESVYFGLNLRQLIFSALACLVAVGLYFLLKPYLSLETLSWLCILGAVPFAALGFVTYNGMTAEKLLVCWFRSEFLIPIKLKYKSRNTHYEAVKSDIDKRIKEEMKNID